MIQQMLNMIITVFPARFMLNDVPHMLNLANSTIPVVVTLPIETQNSMHELMEKAKSDPSKREYGIPLHLSNGMLYLGFVIVGEEENISVDAESSGLGFFHTHSLGEPPYLSETDAVNIFLFKNQRIQCIGDPEYSTYRASIASLIKEPPRRLLLEIIDDLPGIMDESVHISEMENYYTEYSVDLGEKPVLIEVLSNWHPPPLGEWWNVTETLDEYLKRKGIG